jgi:hypothetical protein
MIIATIILILLTAVESIPASGAKQMPFTFPVRALGALN